MICGLLVHSDRASQTFFFWFVFPVAWGRGGYGYPDIFSLELHGFPDKQSLVIFCFRVNQINAVKWF
jgi:hypothetical protein